MTDLIELGAGGKAKVFFEKVPPGASKAKEVMRLVFEVDSPPTISRTYLAYFTRDQAAVLESNLIEVVSSLYEEGETTEEKED